MLARFQLRDESSYSVTYLTTAIRYAYPILTSINEAITLYHSRVRLQLNVSQRNHALKLLIDVDRRLLNFVNHVSIYYTTAYPCSGSETHKTRLSGRCGQ
jgi:hypothetical protein